MISALYDIASPSVSLSVTLVDQSKRLLMKFSPYGSPIILLLRGKFHQQKFYGFLSSGGVK